MDKDQKKDQNDPSVRPKIRSNIRNNDECSKYEPLENRKILFFDQNKKKQSIPLISKEFNVRINCIHYYEPSFDEFTNLVPASMNTWMINCKKFDLFLSLIVNLPYFRFWSVIVYNKEVHSAIESYLTYSIRPYRIHPLLKNKEIKPILSNIHVLVFRFYVRMLLNKESPKNYLSENYHSELLIKNNIIDISKILDLIQLYGYGSNWEILKYLLKSFISKNYSYLKNDFEFVLGEVLKYFHQDENENYDDNDIVYIIASVTDALFSLNKLIQIEPQIAFIFKEINLIEPLVTCYIKYFPLIENETNNLLQKNAIPENLYNYFRSQICLSKASALLLFHNIIRLIFIEPLVNLQNDKYQVFENLMNFLYFIANEIRFYLDYFNKFPFEKEFEVLLKNKELNDQLNIIEIFESYNTSLKVMLQEYIIKNEKLNDGTNFSQMDANLEIVQEIEQFSLKTDPETLNKEQSIIEMFPDLGDGFVYKCLEYYDFNNERVIDAILESNLPPELNSLNRELKKSDILKMYSTKESPVEEKNNTKCADSIKYNPKTNEYYELTDIYIGKKDKLNKIDSDKIENKNKTMKMIEKMYLEEEIMKENIKTLIEHGKLNREELQTNEKFIGFNIYDDEFDDTYENKNDFNIEPLDNESENDIYSNEENLIITKDVNQFNSNNQQSQFVPKYKPHEKYKNKPKYFRNKPYLERNQKEQ